MAEEARLTIRINPEKRKALKDKAESEGKNTTEVLLEFIDQYLGIKHINDPLEQRVTRLEQIVSEKLGELAA
ncbi:MAG: hypothetical protein HEQ35_17730 [Gloeotrichia echinulata IR180]|jgi:hypothetical protein|nr:hypothetical protein [Gloeotrichia echinulata DEX184]